VSRLPHPPALPRSLLATNKLTLKLAPPIPTMPTKKETHTQKNNKKTLNQTGKMKRVREKD
jgi:hypothetical protein